MTLTNQQKIGGNQRKSRKSKMERLVGRVITITFILKNGDEITLKSRLEVKNDSLGKYFLQKYDIPVYLKNVSFNGYDPNLKVKVPEGSYIEQQLKEIEVK